MGNPATRRAANFMVNEVISCMIGFVCLSRNIDGRFQFVEFLNSYDC